MSEIADRSWEIGNARTGVFAGGCRPESGNKFPHSKAASPRCGGKDQNTRSTCSRCVLVGGTRQRVQARSASEWVRSPPAAAKRRGKCEGDVTLPWGRDSDHTVLIAFGENAPGTVERRAETVNAPPAGRDYRFFANLSCVSCISWFSSSEVSHD